MLVVTVVMRNFCIFFFVYGKSKILNYKKINNILKVGANKNRVELVWEVGSLVS